MEIIQDKEAVRGFVQQVLGCSCPEEVFDRIEYHRVRIGGETAAAMTVGGRLLLYLLPVEDASLLDSLLPRLVETGRLERDRRGLNRFRAVLVTAEKERILAAVASMTAATVGLDEKIHLHVVSRQEAPCKGENR